jgi:hypothetical protein
MKIQQLSLFLENKPGQMIEPCRLLAHSGVSILALTLADTQHFGLLRLIVSDAQRSRALLEEAGYLVNVTEVVAIEVADTPGGLSELLELFEGAGGRPGVNIEYMYAFTFGRHDRAVMIFRFENPDLAIERLRGAGRNAFGNIELSDRISV